MKKLIALLLALMMVMVSVAALATGEIGDEDPKEPALVGNGTTTPDIDYVKDTDYDKVATQALTVEIDKKYTFSVLEGATIPAHSLSFAVEATGMEDVGASVQSQPVVTIDPVTIEEKTANTANSTYPVTIHLPAFSEVGVYSYKITETDTNVAGVTYHTSPWYLKVTVTRNTATGELLVAGIAIREDNSKDEAGKNTGTKIDSLDNSFSSGAVKIKKIVSGNMGDRSKTWNVTVTFKSGDKTVNNTIKYTDDGQEKTIAPGWSGDKPISITLVHDEEITFTNVPTDVSYTIAETEANQDGYTTTYTNASGDIPAADTNAEQIENNKEITPDTGITLETLPYVLLMALAAMGFVALKLRKREEY